MRLITVVGARPQFIKAAMVSHQIKTNGGIEETIVHTGQHFDYGMSDVFFDELGIPHPKYNLGISGGTHAQMTGRMMESLEEVFMSERPEMTLLYGDTNSTLAAALVAAKLHIPIVHVEAGARTWSGTNPEEVNRICTDHVSSLLLACTEGNVTNLKNEGLGGRSLFVGDPMLDAFVQYEDLAKRPVLSTLLGGAQLSLPSEYLYLTCHREENTGRDDILANILAALNTLSVPVVYPVHPRNKETVCSLMGGGRFGNIVPVEPVGYLESVYLVSHANQVVTDSGGLQREAFFAGVKCTTVLDFEVWPETMVDNRNLLAKPEMASILEAMGKPQHVDPDYRPFGDGEAARRIVEAIGRSEERG